ncbi:trypsin-like peptidase domain-containing protein [Oceanobacter sp. 3_MG-2023]|uniref:trypsin-like peptidase domain-containing protein n=2 Tax=Gammaproteobacteria TaxID=1236 RepID=UPI00273271FD|nr:trypsin-like peptidase domain-containing protein [Oceanobacter sp. 3_MG-2023]MDP2505333.1 trypsin-like peptidase domain-containing protein [Oceanobacter sp. 3_MG-2023]
MPRYSFVHTMLVPSLVGLCVALMILLWAPQWVTSTARESGQPAAAIQHSAQSSTGMATSYADAVERAAPAVVNIYTSKVVKRKQHPLFDDPLFQRFFNTTPEPDERLQSSLGSGVIMTTEGHILTNNHVIKDADQIVVALHDGREASATLIGSDPEADLAILKIDMPDLPIIPVAHDEHLRVGDVVLAIGNPFGVGQTVTLGIVSATGRNQLGLNTYENYIQTDAAINPGNSGGALINAKGELVGINTAIYSQSGGSEGIGFAIPVAVAQRALTDISQHGIAIRGWLGIEVQEATPKLLDALALPEALEGLIVTGIYQDGPADLSGLTVGDIIVKINQMDTKDARKAMNQIAILHPGDKILLDFIRDGKLAQTEAIAGQRGTQNSDAIPAAD